MLVKSFLAWIEKAGPEDRAEAVDLLAKAYLSRTLGEEAPELVEAALTLILDDASRFVRRALAIAFADQAHAPRHIVLALATDHPEIASPLLARSPLLQEADLVDIAAHADPRALVAIALRTLVTGRLAHALMIRDQRDCCLALAGNPGAEIADEDLIAMAMRFGKDGPMRDALLARANVPALVRYHLMMALNVNLQVFAGEGGLLNGEKNRRMVEEALQQGILSIAARARGDLGPLVHYLRQEQRLTSGLLLRSVLGGDTALLTEALADLTGMTRERVSGLMRGRADATLAALFRRAGLPAFLEQPLIAAVRAAQALPAPMPEAGLSLPVIRAAQSACLSLAEGDEFRLMALLRRYEADAARVHSRRLAEELLQEAQGELARLTLTAEQAEELTALTDAREAPAVEIAGIEIPATLCDRPVETAQPAEKLRAPKLRSLIEEWKRERGEDPSVSILDHLPKPANESRDFDGWEIRRSVA